MTELTKDEKILVEMYHIEIAYTHMSNLIKGKNLDPDNSLKFPLTGIKNSLNKIVDYHLNKTGLVKSEVIVKREMIGKELYDKRHQNKSS